MSRWVLEKLTLVGPCVVGGYFLHQVWAGSFQRLATAAYTQNKPPGSRKFQIEPSCGALSPSCAPWGSGPSGTHSNTSNGPEIENQFSVTFWTPTQPLKSDHGHQNGAKLKNNPTWHSFGQTNRVGICRGEHKSGLTDYQDINWGLTMTSLVDSPSFQHKSVKTSRTFFERESATDKMFWKYFLWMPAIWKWFATSSHWVDLDFAFLFKIQLWLRLTLNKTLRALSWLLKGIDNIKVLECASPSFLSNPNWELNYTIGWKSIGAWIWWRFSRVRFNKPTKGFVF